MLINVFINEFFFNVLFLKKFVNCNNSLLFEFDKLHFLNNVFIVCKFLQLLTFFLFHNYVSLKSFFSTKTQRNIIVSFFYSIEIK